PRPLLSDGGSENESKRSDCDNGAADMLAAALLRGIEAICCIPPSELLCPRWFGGFFECVHFLCLRAHSRQAVGFVRHSMSSELRTVFIFAELILPGWLVSRWRFASRGDCPV